MENSISAVKDFWGVEACGAQFAAAEKGTPEFFEQFRRFRHQVEWHIAELVPFEKTRGKKVLEIGCGNGADGVMFALAGADYTGVDLTGTAVEATRTHFQVLGLAGRFQIENAENLSFPDGSFDFVYSHGVLHHTPNPDGAFGEVYRVLRPGGEAVLMLYHKHSFNYYIRILGYMRARALLYILGRAGRFSADRRAQDPSLPHLRGNEDSRLWHAHYQNFLRHGWSYLRARNFVHHATDGPECPFAYVYTAKTIRQACRDFRIVRTTVAHFPLRKYSFIRWVPFWLERKLAHTMGWYLFVYLTK